MDRQEELRQWFTIADTDFKTAEYLTTMRYPTPDAIICFHCQQAVEKYLKGFLFFNNMTPPKIHDLIALIGMCEKVIPSFAELRKQCIFINRYSVIPRYPIDIEVTAADVNLALQYVKEVREFIVKAGVWN